MYKIFFFVFAFTQTSMVFAASSMNLGKLRREAFARCQKPYVKVSPPTIPQLDPPTQGGPEAIGLVYLEELSIRTQSFLDQHDFYFIAKPRAALNTLPMDIFISADGGLTYNKKTWADAKPDYSSPAIQPPIDTSTLPPAGRVLTELIIGHKSPTGDFPQLFDFRSSGYIRFAGYPPAITGASLRVAAHRISGTHLPGNSAGEDFPEIRQIYASALSAKTARALLLVESELFCSAILMDLNEGSEASVTADGYWYTRENFDWEKSPHTALVAYSSMLWKTENHTPHDSTDEAHDSDTLKVYYKKASPQIYVLSPPSSGIAVTEFSRTDETPKRWILANDDRNPEHYAEFAPALGSTNYQYRASYEVDILESNIKTAVAM
ncbi:MAG: glucan biosynthesis protein, partial [Bdellovibrionales bacterium]|nr:glucan biosynthesis protein [Bdellovibrionales bacterium]